MSTPARPSLPAGLYALCDDTVRPELDVVDKAQLLLKGGVKVMQLRLKKTPVRKAVIAARSVVELCRLKGAVCLVNDRADWALVSDAHGVHVGDEDLLPKDARKVIGDPGLVGVTCRGPEDIVNAQRAGADYAGVGPVFATTTKRVAVPPMGLGRLAEIVAASPLPIVAIAGITLENIEAVARAGVHCAAVGSDLYRTNDIPARVQALSEAFARGRVWA